MPTSAIKAIFFTRFHHEKGSRVLHQVPEGSITPSTSPSALHTPLVSLEAIQSYLIPNQQFCDRLLTFCTNHYRVIGYPVCIREGKYSRNEFIFNFAVVVEEGGDWAAVGEMVRKLGRLLRGLEEQSGWVSGEEGEGSGAWDDETGAGVSGGADGFGIGGGSKVYALCEMVLEDLNNYAECMIPIDDSNTINLKLFPTRTPPPPIYAHQVPVLTISLSSLSKPISSDLTLNRILPYVNGINSVSYIAQLADTDLSLTRKAIQHLVYYGCLILLDIFSFGAVYAPTAEFGGFVADESVQDECARYVRVPRLDFGSWNGVKFGSESSKTRSDERSSISSTRSHPSDTSGSPNRISETHPAPTVADDSEAGDAHDIPHVILIQLYASLRQGVPLRTWVLENLDLLGGIDIRRFITFGIIKGFLYRVHRYAVVTRTGIPMPPAPPTSLQSALPSTDASASTSFKGSHDPSDQSTIRDLANPLRHKPSTASASASFVFGTSNGAGGAPDRRLEDVVRLDSIASADQEHDELSLVKFLDGMHCFDEICTELGATEREVETTIKGVGEVYVFSR